MAGRNTLLRDNTAAGIYNRGRKKLGVGRQTPAQVAQGQAQAGMGYGGQPRTVMSSTPSSAAETMAFQEGKKNRALYGKYGKGGLEREKITSEQQRNVATAAQKAAEFDLKRQKNTREEALAKWKMAGGDGLGLDSVQQAGARTTGGSPIAAQQTPGTAQVPAQPPVINPSAFPAPDTPMTALQPGTGGIRVPEGAAGKANGLGGNIGKPGYYGMNQQGATQFTPGAPGAPAVAPAATPSRMDSGMFSGFQTANTAQAQAQAAPKPITPGANPVINIQEGPRGQPRTIAEPSIAPMHRAANRPGGQNDMLRKLLSPNMTPKRMKSILASMPKDQKTGTWAKRRKAMKDANPQVGF